MPGKGTVKLQEIDLKIKEAVGPIIASFSWLTSLAVASNYTYIDRQPPPQLLEEIASVL